MKSFKKSKLLQSTGVFLLLSIAACKPNNSSDTKSFVGLEADIDSGNAPSFKLLQQWFDGALPINEEAAQAGRVTYKVHQQFGGETWSQIPPQYREDIFAYFRQQIGIVVAFQAAKSNPTELKRLLKQEAKDMYEILMVLIAPGYVPQTDDLLAKIMSVNTMRNFTNRFSLELLEKLYQRDRDSLIKKLGQERDNFAAELIKTYVDEKAGINERFAKDLANDCSKLITFMNSLGGKLPAVMCSTTGGSAGFQLNGVPDVYAAAAAVGGGAQKFLGIFAGAVGGTSGKGYAAAAGSMPQLSIFQGKDPLAGDTGGPVTPYTPTNPTTPTTPTNPTVPTTPITPQAQLESLLAQVIGPNWKSQISGAQTDPSLTETKAGMALSNSPSVIKNDCLSNPRTSKGLPLVLCRTHPFVNIGALNHSVSNTTKTNSSGSFGAVDGYNFIPVAKYYTEVQDQGQEGACTAFGLIHTIIANVQSLPGGRGFTTPATEQWQAQGQQPYTQTAVSTARQRDFGSFKVGNATDIEGVDAIKQVISQGRAVYASSEVDNSWYTPGNKLSCGDASGAAGHAYSLQGYDDSQQVFILKNSWGDGWGEFGYGYLPYSCITQFKQADWYDVPMVAK